MVNGGGIDVFDLDQDGEIVTSQQKQGLSEDEIDDLVVQYAYLTNKLGLQAMEKFSPVNRIQTLLQEIPEFFDTYIEILEFLQKKHSFAEVDTLLRGREVLALYSGPDERPAQPSIFIDKLEKAGGIYWDDGWLITRGGKETLDLEAQQREE